ncbi:MAG TPA: alternative ribosome rescue aminoacyl-tRNA hydrolase ArfB [Chryseolinea sp.]|nr:alternative ribosome rescue aminoacyl-tRNA hydrolase ArfB [Chryseolinea sp.]
MTSRSITASLLFNELDFTASRSGGPGGQNVNKVNSKISVKFDVVRSQILNEDEKAIILRKLSTHLTKEGVLMLSSQDKRSQLENKQTVIEKLERLIAKAFEKKKIRKPTKVSKSAIQKRITSKKLHAEKKKWRQSPE